ncbi:MAG: GNAT family N-acetyltransferase [Candidatus Eremiobacteraeota bacterium]|nr:GNAT family N-acetyltransferase [Candidatus Eremiobacteraeota bacterium]
MSEPPLSRIGGTTLRRANAADATTLGTLRAAMSSERTRCDEAASRAFAATCASFFARELTRSEPFLRVWVASDDERIVATAALTTYRTLPRLASVGEVDGRVRDVYVVPEYRRRGIARALMALVLDEARSLSVDRLALGASVMGRPLYETLGFVSKTDEMLYAPPNV